jgi:hypothetical protein
MDHKVGFLGCGLPGDLRQGPGIRIIAALVIKGSLHAAAGIPQQNDLARFGTYFWQFPPIQLNPGGV